MDARDCPVAVSAHEGYVADSTTFMTEVAQRHALELIGKIRS